MLQPTATLDSASINICFVEVECRKVIQDRFFATLLPIPLNCAVLPVAIMMVGEQVSFRSSANCLLVAIIRLFRCFIFQIWLSCPEVDHKVVYCNVEVRFVMIWMIVICPICFIVEKVSAFLREIFLILELIEVFEEIFRNELIVNARSLNFKVQFDWISPCELIVTSFLIIRHWERLKVVRGSFSPFKNHPFITTETWRAMRLSWNYNVRVVHTYEDVLVTISIFCSFSTVDVV